MLLVLVCLQDIIKRMQVYLAVNGPKKNKHDQRNKKNKQR